MAERSGWLKARPSPIGWRSMLQIGKQSCQQAAGSARVWRSVNPLQGGAAHLRSALHDVTTLSQREHARNGGFCSAPMQKLFAADPGHDRRVSQRGKDAHEQSRWRVGRRRRWPPIYTTRRPRHRQRRRRASGRRRRLRGRLQHGWQRRQAMRDRCRRCRRRRIGRQRRWSCRYRNRRTGRLLSGRRWRGQQWGSHRLQRSGRRP